MTGQESCPNTAAHPPRPLAPNRVFCESCWTRLPADLKAEIFTALRAYRANTTSGDTVERYTDIMQLAVKELNG